MTTVPKALIGEFIDASVDDRKRAAELLAEHPDLLNARWLHGETVLHFLAVEGFRDAVRFLVECGADVDAVNDFGDSPLIDVTVLGRTDIAEMLLQHGANPNALSATWDPILHCAVERGNTRLVDVLLAAGADARSVTEFGGTVFDALPLSDPDRAELLAILAKYGVRPDAG